MHRVDRLSFKLALEESVAMTKWGWGLTLGLLPALLPALAGAASLQLQVLDRDGRPVEFAVLSLEGAGLAAQTTGPVELAQVDKAFVPPVLAVRTGTAVNFPNRDRMRHHVYSFSPAKRFELRLYSGTPAEPVLFDKPGLVVLGCNIHDWMVGYLYITDAPLFAVTDALGRVNFELPPGDYQLGLWHPSNPDLLPQARGELAVGAAGLNQSLSLEWQVAPLVQRPPAPSAFGQAFEDALRESPQ